MNRTLVRCSQNRDENGVLEEFTKDLANVINVADVVHLEDNGLPRIGTEVRPGMLLIGKIGGKKVDPKLKTMNELDQLIASQKELRAYWRQRIYDACLYAPVGCNGIVIQARFEEHSGKQEAVVVVESP